MSNCASNCFHCDCIIGVPQGWDFVTSFCVLDIIIIPECLDVLGEISCISLSLCWYWVLASLRLLWVLVLNVLSDPQCLARLF